MSSCMDGTFHLEMHLITKRVLATVNVWVYDHLLAFHVADSHFAFEIFDLMVFDFSCYVACCNLRGNDQWNFNSNEMRISHTSNIYFIQMNANNKLMLTFLLRFLFNFYLLGLFYYLSAVWCSMRQCMHTRCWAHTHTHNARHIEFVWAYMSKQQQLKQKLARNVKQLLKIQVMLHVCTVHACMNRIPAMRMHLKTGMRNVDFVCVGVHRICEIVLKLSPNCVCMNIKCIHSWREVKPKASVLLWSGLGMQQASSTVQCSINVSVWFYLIYSCDIQRACLFPIFCTLSIFPVEHHQVATFNINFHRSKSNGMLFIYCIFPIRPFITLYFITVSFCSFDFVHQFFTCSDYN